MPDAQQHPPSELQEQLANANAQVSDLQRDLAVQSRLLQRANRGLCAIQQQLSGLISQTENTSTANTVSLHNHYAPLINIKAYFFTGRTGAHCIITPMRGFDLKAQAV